MNLDVRMVDQNQNYEVNLEQPDVFMVSMRDIQKNFVSMEDLGSSHQVEMAETSSEIDARLKDVQIITKTYLDPYEGAYEVTPTQETQILPTELRLIERNIVVNPIPSNYGRITWNGTVLTVS